MKTSKFLFSLLGGGLIAALALSPTDSLRAQCKSAEWKPLFNGKNLDGWVVRGGNAKFDIKNGEIIGIVAAKTPNTFLCTEKNYGDFVLELEFNCPAELNSGVQIRSEYLTEDRVVKDAPPLPGQKPRTVKLKAGNVSGYQVEIDYRSGRTGGIYDEARRNGWVYPQVNSQQDKEFRAQGEKIIKAATWQKLRVETSGSTIRTFIDGHLRADARDTMSSTGIIALQVHSSPVRDAGKQIRFRNIRIKEVSPTPIAVPSAAK
ncbi:MAG: DUF1080 domain-containing protein [Puniceicoccales bacterium]|jgi:hypothetical protein|nr:DUF1080 domain-containing protein [Puniceicoccales bacterium]